RRANQPRRSQHKFLNRQERYASALHLFPFQDCIGPNERHRVPYSASTLDVVAFQTWEMMKKRSALDDKDSIGVKRSLSTVQYKEAQHHQGLTNLDRRLFKVG
ncbi:hypothetical protein CLAIMM_06477, partial [Cladophialophora immunda]